MTSPDPSTLDDILGRLKRQLAQLSAAQERWAQTPQAEWPEELKKVGALARQVHGAAEDLHAVFGRFR